MELERTQMEVSFNFIVIDSNKCVFQGVSRRNIQIFPVERWLEQIIYRICVSFLFAEFLQTCRIELKFLCKR